MLLTKDGITIDVSSPIDIAMYKKLGFAQVKDIPAVVVETPEELPAEKSPEEKNSDAIKDANKPIGSKKKGGEK